jgi:hypothetical protein
MEHSHDWEARNHSADREIPPLLSNRNVHYHTHNSQTKHEQTKDSIKTTRAADDKPKAMVT